MPSLRLDRSPGRGHEARPVVSGPCEPRRSKHVLPQISGYVTQSCFVSSRGRHDRPGRVGADLEPSSLQPPLYPKGLNPNKGPASSAAVFRSSHKSLSLWSPRLAKRSCPRQLPPTAMGSWANPLTSLNLCPLIRQMEAHLFNQDLMAKFPSTYYVSGSVPATGAAREGDDKQNK